jgi:ATP-dependent Clp protease adaptor protein ClpS
MPITIKPYLDIQYEKPKMYFVTIINDRHVSWKFCMRILMEIFHMNVDDAMIVSNEIVTNGEGFCGGYMFEIAQTKAELVEKEAKEAGFSLTCLVEEV